MAQRLTIDLKKNPEVASAVADSQVGDEVEVKATIQALDEQTLTIEVEEVIAEDSAADEQEDAEDDQEDASSEAAPMGGASDVTKV